VEKYPPQGCRVARGRICAKNSLTSFGIKDTPAGEAGLKTPVDQETVEFDSGCYVTLRRSSH